jgi:transcriptional regulator with XRE-family HTH domain
VLPARGGAHLTDIGVSELDIAELAAMLRQRRGSLSLRQAAEEAGVSFSTFSRVESGSQPDLASFSRLCTWLRVPPTRFFRSGSEREIDALDTAISHLHSDPRLNDDAKRSIANVLRDMYAALAAPPEPPSNLIACHLRATPAMRPGVPERVSGILTDLHAELERRVRAGTL